MSAQFAACSAVKAALGRNDLLSVSFDRFDSRRLAAKAGFGADRDAGRTARAAINGSGELG
jgi:hypothetical protein